MVAAQSNTQIAIVYCPICTRYVEGNVRLEGRRAKVVPGQKCPRRASTLDAAPVIQLPQAA